MRLYIALMLLAVGSGGCVAGIQPYHYAQTTVAGLGAAVDEIESRLPDTEEHRQAIALARESVQIGANIADMWEQAKERPAEWSAWINHAFDIVTNLMQLMKAAGLQIPDAVFYVVGLLQNLWLTFSGTLLTSTGGV